MLASPRKLYTALMINVFTETKVPNYSATKDPVSSCSITLFPENLKEPMCG